VLYRWEAGELDCTIDFVISNHLPSDDSHLCVLLKRLNIPFHHLPTSKLDRATSDEPRDQERAILEIAKNTDLLVLARYMQVRVPARL